MEPLMKKLIVIFFLIISAPLYAFDGITYYSATITDNDRYSSGGQRLNSIDAILRQERTNIYRGGNPDNQQSDPYFNTSENRNLFYQVPIKINPELGKRIMKSGEQVYITVFVFKNYIEVR